jgi:hypothetical protein
MFRDRKNECITVVLKPHRETVHWVDAAVSELVIGLTNSRTHQLTNSANSQCGSSLLSFAARSVSVGSLDGAQFDRLCQPLCA